MRRVKAWEVPRWIQHSPAIHGGGGDQNKENLARILVLILLSNDNNYKPIFSHRLQCFSNYFWFKFSCDFFSFYSIILFPWNITILQACEILISMISYKYLYPMNTKVKPNLSSNIFVMAYLFYSLESWVALFQYWKNFPK